MRKRNVLKQIAANTQRKATTSATKAVYMGIWGTTPEADRQKARKK